MDQSGAGKGAGERLAALAARYSGWDPKLMKDVDGDLQLRDSPFGVWARLPSPVPGVLFVACPLIEFQVQEAARQVLDRLLEGRASWVVEEGAIQLFRLAPPETLEGDEAFRREAEAMLEVGRAVVEAIQPAHGGLTGEQWRVLQGWRAHDPQTEAVLAGLVAGKSAKLIRHGWDPASESLPLLVSETSAPPMVRRFATVDGKGTVRLRTTTRQVRGSEPGFALKVVQIEPKEALAWAEALGLAPKGKVLTPESVKALQGRSWDELMAPLKKLPHLSTEAWQAAAGR